jgi:ATP-dependent protease ClpP protease subunit
MKTIRLIEDITEQTLPRIMDELNNTPDDSDVVIQIASCGGAVFYAYGIIDYLYRRGFKTTAEIYGIAASAAALIALSCDVVEITDFGSMLIHGAYLEDGTHDAGIDRANEIQLKIIHRRNADFTMQDLERDNWYSAKQCLDMGFADKILHVSDELFATCNAYFAKALLSHRGEQTMKVKAEEKIDEQIQNETVDAERDDMRDGERDGDGEVSLTDIIEALAQRVDRLEARIGELEKGRSDDAMAACGEDDKQQARLNALYARVMKPTMKRSAVNDAAAKAKAELDDFNKRIDINKYI